MATSAWIFMLTAWGVVTIMTILSFRKLLASQTVLQVDDEPPDDRPEPWGAPPTMQDG